MNVKYEVIIYWSPEDADFLAEVPELPGWMADGTTPPRGPIEPGGSCGGMDRHREGTGPAGSRAPWSPYVRLTIACMRGH